MKLQLVSISFNYSGHKCNCWRKVVNHWDKRDNGIMCTGKEIKFGLKLLRMETDVAIPGRTKKIWVRISQYGLSNSVSKSCIHASSF